MSDPIAPIAPVLVLTRPQCPMKDHGTPQVWTSFLLAQTALRTSLPPVPV